MRRFTKISLSTLNHVDLDFSLKNEHNYRIADVFKVLNYVSDTKLCMENENDYIENFRKILKLDGKR